MKSDYQKYKINIRKSSHAILQKVFIRTILGLLFQPIFI